VRRRQRCCTLALVVAATALAAVGPAAGVLVHAAHAGATTTPYGPQPTQLWVLTAANELVRIDAAGPGVPLESVPVTGFAELPPLAIDSNPDTGDLLLTTGTPGGLVGFVRVGALDVVTGVFHSFNAHPQPRSLGNPDPGFSFVPGVGEVATTSEFGATGNYSGMDAQTGEIGRDLTLTEPDLVGLAYTESFAGSPGGVGYAIDAQSDELVRLDEPGDGSVVATAVGPLGVDTDARVGFDIDATDGTAYASLTVGGVSQLYAIDLTTGGATLVGTIADGAPVIGLAVVPLVVPVASTRTWTESSPYALVGIDRPDDAAEAPLTLAWDVVPGTATAGTDVAAVSGAVSWAAGEAGSRFVRIPLVDDSVASEPARGLDVRFSVPSTGRVVALLDVTLLDREGTWIADRAGRVVPTGPVPAAGSAPTPLVAPVVGIEAHPAGDGYWLIASDGGVFSFGGAAFSGSMGGRVLQGPIVGLQAHPAAVGYWMVGTDGGVFGFGGVGFFGSMGGTPLQQPVVGMEATPSGDGYWLVAADGGVFAFGDAAFHGSLGALRLQQPIVGMEATPSGDGYWLVAADGGVFAFGDAPFSGSLGATAPPAPIVDIERSPNGGGYWLIGADGTVTSFGDAPAVAAVPVVADQAIVGLAAA
jgi:hypothetical protein